MSKPTTIIEFGILVMSTIIGTLLVIYQARIIYVVAIAAVLVWGVRLPRAFTNVHFVGYVPKTRLENFIDSVGLLVGGGLLVASRFL